MAMKAVRQTIGGLGNLMFKQAYLWSQMRDGMIPDVYVQSERFFKKYNDEVKQLFGDGIGFTDKVSIHIRLGDYVNNEFYVNLLETDYYKKAISIFPNDTFLLFCADRQHPYDRDDREIAVNFISTIIPRNRFELYEGKDEIDDLNKMASCQSNIMANSSFSWWASYLNKNPDKKVICPAQWFSDGLQRCELLDEWIKI
jgi:hypothetical protein